MGKELATVGNGPNNIKAYVEDFLLRAGPNPGKYLVTRIEGSIDAMYSLRHGIPESVLREVDIAFDVNAQDVSGELEIEVRVRVAADGTPRIDHWKLTAIHRDAIGWSTWGWEG